MTHKHQGDGLKGRLNKKWRRVEENKFDLCFTFLVRRPRRQYSRWQSLYTIFSTKVWIITLGTILSATLTFWFSRKVSKFTTKTSLCESLLMMFGMMTLSSTATGPPRTLLFCWSLFSLLFTSALMGSVVTRLAVPLFSERVDTYRQAVEAGYHWVNPDFYRRADYLQDYMFNMNNSWQKKFVARYMKTEPEEVKQHLKTDLYVMLPAQRWGDDFLIVSVAGIKNSSDLQDFRVMREPTRDVFTSFAFKKGSPLNEPLSVAIQSLIDRGLWDYCKRTHTNKGVVKRSKQLMEERDLSVLSQPEPFTLLKLYPLFALLAVGLSLAFVVFICELWWSTFYSGFINTT